MNKELVLEGQELLFKLDELTHQAAIDQDRERWTRLDNLWNKAHARYERRYNAWKAPTTS